MTVSAYTTKYPGARTVSDTAQARFDAHVAGIIRQAPALTDKATITIKGMEFQAYPGVPPEACLPMPAHYQLPASGDLSKKINHVLLALQGGASCYV